jgi:hypothetical protein
MAVLPNNTRPESGSKSGKTKDAKKKKRNLAEKLLSSGKSFVDDAEIGLSKKSNLEKSPNDRISREREKGIGMVTVMAQYLVSNVGLFIGTWVYATVGE